MAGVGLRRKTGFAEKSGGFSAWGRCGPGAVRRCAGGW
ncbi:hypothetical protein APASM_6126 [Actinosynnema pretiosum subsp. pretiosum]|nr:hypothetical protein APASM_6126 [Actinosynnema pretiosum subsp. pretiosum]